MARDYDFGGDEQHHPVFSGRKKPVSTDASGRFYPRGGETGDERLEGQKGPGYVDVTFDDLSLK